jgi:galactokinase
MNDLSVSTPGRICLFGEHQDYLGLPIIAGAISLRIEIAGNHSASKDVIIDLPDIQSSEIFTIDAIWDTYSQTDFFKSSISVLKREGYKFSTGIECQVKSQIPIKSGTSSSAALVVSWINFLTRMSIQNKACSPEEIARLAVLAEVAELSGAGGIMDQYSTAIGDVIFLDPSAPEALIKMNPNLGTIILGDSKESKETQDMLLQVKRPVLKIIEIIKKEDPDFTIKNVSIIDADSYEKVLSEQQLKLLITTLKNRDITYKAKEELMKPVTNITKIGILVNNLQKILRDSLKISTEKIDNMVAAALDAGAYGAKINGSGGGGCMFAMTIDNPGRIARAIERQGGKAYIVRIDRGTEAIYN